MQRRHNFQTVSWFHDLSKRTLINFDPPYQRRSVWNQAFKDYFVDTVLLNYPSPAIFLFENIEADGRSTYSVVDGKQRLMTLLEFVRDTFPVSDTSDIHGARGKYFSSLYAQMKKDFWSYQFLVEYIPTDDEKIINTIFDRINRNVAKLTPQELRHARLAGCFISSAESLTKWMIDNLPKNFPRIVVTSRSQMKDVELTAQLLLLIESGAHGYSQDDLDQEFTSRDTEWEPQERVESDFRETIQYIHQLTKADPEIEKSKLRNQADFYSLFGAICELHTSNQLPKPPMAAKRLLAFISRLEDSDERLKNQDLAAYYEAARSASSDKGPREKRISIIKQVLLS